MARSKYPDIPSDFYIFHHQITRPIHWPDFFGRKAPLDVEIGFGLGDFLVRMAQVCPERNFVGIEKEGMCIYRTLRKIDAINRTARPPDVIRNIRIMQIPAEVALERFFSLSSINKVYSLFPCPWPKKRHAKHRTFSNKFLRLVNSRLILRGELKIVTDHRPYCDWIKAQGKSTGFAVQTKFIAPQYQTKYERKWHEGGQEKFYEILFRKKRHIRVALKEDAAVKDYFIPQFDPSQFRFADTTGPTAIIFKDFIFDAAEEKGMVQLVVAEENLSQHIWVMIARQVKGFKISLAPGSTVLPTEAVAQALADVYRAGRRSAQHKQADVRDKK